MATQKTRLDVLVYERGLSKSREHAQALIMSGVVWSLSLCLNKAGEKYPSDIPLEIRDEKLPFVSRGGLKLDHALTLFQVPVSGRVCLDIGASTGGFTDCLVQRGAARVFAVDVGYGQIDQKLSQHPAVVVVERTNARHLTLQALRDRHPEADQISLVVMDVSFISLEKIILPLRLQFSQPTEWVLLFKPQFEVGKSEVGKGGIVKSQEAVERALSQFHLTMEQAGFRRKNSPIASPLAGKKSGNLEYLLHYEK